MEKRLSKRKEEILKYIITCFAQNPEPVGSKRLQEVAGLGVSSATIRNEMSELERLGYIAHPHTSAGRVPTDKGYRYYVDHLVAARNLQTEKIMRMVYDLKREMYNMDEFFKAISEIIAIFAQQVGVIVFPALDDLSLRYVNIIPIGNKRHLIVWATMSGLIHEQVICFDDDISPETIQRIANFINTEFIGMPFHAVENFLKNKRKEMHDSVTVLLDFAEKIVHGYAAMRQRKKVWVEGRNRFFDEPEFQSIVKVKPIFDALDDQAQVAHIFDNNTPNTVLQVTIGHENAYEHFWNCSIIRRSFEINPSLYGTISVLGPRRMDYEQIFSVVNNIAAGMSNMMQENNQ